MKAKVRCVLGPLWPSFSRQWKRTMKRNYKTKVVKVRLRKKQHNADWLAAALWGSSLTKGNCPTSPFTIWEPQDPWIDEFLVVYERRATDLKASKLGKETSRPILIYCCAANFFRAAYKSSIDVILRSGIAKGLIGRCRLKTIPFAASELQNRSNEISELPKIHRSSNFGVSKLWKGRSC